VSEHRNPADKLLDLLLYGPAGLAVTAVEEFPRLVEKGRHRIDGQLHAARLVGQFAVQMGRRQLDATVGQWLGGSSAPGSVHVPQHVEPAQAPAAQADEPDADPSAASPPVSGNGALASEVLGIPGYDSLSASQVVQRLGGLSAVELEAIRGHELAHRHRRTILNRVEQLLGADTELG